ncbi:MAG: hypothetical protein U9N56_06640 [Actinomycetota bacterium]|nr:hypothetical protein [Actinomycetota bacterium]
MTDPQQSHQDQEIKTPFSFKLMVVLVVLYLGWRLVQGVVWLFETVF